MKAPSRMSNVGGGALFGVLAGALVLLLDHAGLFEVAELRSLDWRQRREASRPGAAGAGEAHAVALVLQGERSLEAARREAPEWGWPWPRSVWGAVLELAKREGARGAAFDLFFSEGGRLHEEDLEFAGAIREHGAVSLATAFHPGAADSPPARALARVRELAVTVTADDPHLLELFPARDSIHSLSLDIFLEGARATGNVHELPDRDGIFRRVVPLLRFGGAFYPAFSIANANLALGGGPIHITRERELVLGPPGAERRLPLERDGTLLLRYGPEVSATYDDAIEAYDAITAGANDVPARKGTFFPGAFSGKIVIIGYSATGTFDIRPIPLLERAPGVLVHVAAVENLLSGSALRTWTRNGELWRRLAILLLGAATGALVASTPRALRQVILAGGLGAAWLALSVLVLFPRGLVVDLVAPEAAVFLGLTLGSIYNYLTEGRARRQIKSVFEHYLAPARIEEILSDPDAMALEGKRRELTIFFSDLAGFTTLSETLAPAEFREILRIYLTEMTDVNLRLGGTHDKFIGDAVMAFFGAPHELRDHAALACLSALEQQAALERLNEKWTREGKPRLLARMGINTGEVIVGDLGSETIREYTVMGDAVNLASRLEGANKPFGTLIMCGERTAELARGRIDFRELAGLRVKGKHRAVRVFEVIGKKGATPEARLELARRFEEALRLYEKRRFAEALAIFEALARAHGDEPSKLYAEECARFVEAPPPVDWDGVVTLTSK